jgi:hypothetical protein
MYHKEYMPDLAFNQKLAWDVEFSVSAPFSGVPQFLGALAHEPVMLLVKNQSTSIVFFADNSGSTNGTTMVAGEEIIFDCRSNHGTASNMGFPLGTPFYVTGTAGSGVFKVSILYAY